MIPDGSLPVPMKDARNDLRGDCQEDNICIEMPWRNMILSVIGRMFLIRWSLFVDQMSLCYMCADSLIAENEERFKES